MFDWFFNMPDWLYLIIGGVGVVIFVGYMIRNEAKAWWESATNPPENYWERARREEQELKRPSGLGWPESK